MSWKLSPKIGDILVRAADGAGIRRTDALALMALDCRSRDYYALIQTADALSRACFGDKAENHFHIGVNISPCPFDCLFCSLTRRAGIFTEEKEFSEEQIIAWAREAEAAGADGLNLMTTGTYSFRRLLEIGSLLSREVSVKLVANTRDISHKEGEALLDAGFVGAYHAVRLGEGKDTPFDPKKRIRTFGVFRDVGLGWANCVEPVGPEHGHEEIVSLMFLAREYEAQYSGIMRRINFPGSPMSRYGMITEREMSKMVAVSRLVMGDIPNAHCVHEPHSASLMAGANLFFPEAGASPRDAEADTAKGRGRDISACHLLQKEMGLDPSLPSNCYPETRFR
ncbi:MAG: radical SAM protein [Desulfococcus sp.]|nr:MAG: radical SAM protein [Desulfococcus sp.]